MKKSIKAIGTIAIMAIMSACTYYLGTTQTETITAVQTVTKIKEVVPSGYIKLNDCIPLEDIACYYISDGYITFELKDISYQLDDTNNRSYVNIIEELEYDQH